MQKNLQIISIVLLVGILALVAYIFWPKGINEPQNTGNSASLNEAVTNTVSSNMAASRTAASNTAPSNQATPSNTATPPSAVPKLTTLAEPIAEFKSRITKKPFGKYFSPGNSPVQPERFSGYHTAVDVEYTDTTADIPVFALTDGRVVLSRVASGYGGVFMVQFRFKDKPYTAVYGHIRPSTMPKVATEIQRGQKIGVLGTGYSSETDGERKHLHFGILLGSTTNLKGYAQSTSELSAWIDPLSLFP